MVRALVAIADGSEEIEAVSVIDILRRANGMLGVPSFALGSIDLLKILIDFVCL
jgi:hypothetical protein